MKALIRGFTFILALGLATVSLAQTPQKDTQFLSNVASGTTLTIQDVPGSGTITFSYSFTGTPSGVSIAVQGCTPDGTCTTLTPISGSAPYTTAASGQQQFLGGYYLYKVTPTFTGATLNIYKVGIQAKVNSGSGGGGGNTATGLNGATAPNSANVLGTNSSGQLTSQSATNISAVTTCTGGGTANAQTVTCTPAVTALTTGLQISWIPTVTNTGGATLSINGLAATTLVDCSATRGIIASDLTTGVAATVMYNGTYFQLLNPAVTFCGGSAYTGITMNNQGIGGALFVQANQFLPSGNTPTCTVGAAAGTGATCAILSGSFNGSGQVTLTTGTSTTGSGTLVTVTFNSIQFAPYNCTIMARGASAALLATDVYTTAPTTTSFLINDGATAPAASTANVWGYTCI